jgi:hypothetical protein
MKHTNIRLFIVAAVLACGTGSLRVVEHRVAAQTPTAAPIKATLAVVGGFLLDGFGGPGRPNAVVLVGGDKIVAVGEEGRLAIPPGAKIVDANGYTVMLGSSTRMCTLTSSAMPTMRNGIQWSRTSTRKSCDWPRHSFWRMA